MSKDEIIGILSLGETWWILDEDQRDEAVDYFQSAEKEAGEEVYEASMKEAA